MQIPIQLLSENLYWFLSKQMAISGSIFVYVFNQQLENIRGWHWNENVQILICSAVLQLKFY